jgi:hypothetical protein
LGEDSKPVGNKNIASELSINQPPKRARLQIKSQASEGINGRKYLQEKEIRSPSKTTKQVARRTTHQVYGIPVEDDVLLISAK